VNTMPIVLPSDPLAGIALATGEQSPARGEAPFSEMLEQALAQWVIPDAAAPLGACPPAYLLAMSEPQMAASTLEATLIPSPLVPRSATAAPAVPSEQAGEPPSAEDAAEATPPIAEKDASRTAWDWAGLVALLALLPTKPAGAPLAETAMSQGLQGGKPEETPTAKGIPPIAGPAGLAAKPAAVAVRPKGEATAPQGEPLLPQGSLAPMPSEGPPTRPEETPLQRIEAWTGPAHPDARPEQPRGAQAISVGDAAPVVRAASHPASPALTASPQSHPAETVRQEPEPRPDATSEAGAESTGETDGPTYSLRLVGATATAREDEAPRPDARPFSTGEGERASESRLTSNPTTATPLHSSTGTPTREPEAVAAVPEGREPVGQAEWSTERGRAMTETASPFPVPVGESSVERPAESRQPAPGRDVAQVAGAANPSASAKDGISATEIHPPSLRFSSWVTDRAPMPEAIGRYLVERLTQAIRRGERECRLELYPKELGKVDARLSFADEQLAVHLKVETSQAQRIIQQALPELRHALEARGMQLSQCDVGLIGGEAASGRWSDQSQAQQGFPQTFAPRGEAHRAPEEPAQVAAPTRPRGLVDLMA